MESEKYNGWTNKATWLVNLWITNDYATYKLMEYCDFTTPKQCKKFVEEVIPDHILKSIKTDMDKYWTLEDVNWNEMSEMWSEK